MFQAHLHATKCVNNIHTDKEPKNNINKYFNFTFIFSSSIYKPFSCGPFVVNLAQTVFCRPRLPSSSQLGFLKCFTKHFSQLGFLEFHIPYEIKISLAKTWYQFLMGPLPIAPPHGHSATCCVPSSEGTA